jgi:hypothetical protein
VGGLLYGVGAVDPITFFARPPALLVVTAVPALAQAAHPVREVILVALRAERGSSLLREPPAVECGPCFELQTPAPPYRRHLTALALLREAAGHLGYDSVRPLVFFIT